MQSCTVEQKIAAVAFYFENQRSIIAHLFFCSLKAERDLSVEDKSSTVPYYQKRIIKLRIVMSMEEFLTKPLQYALSVTIIENRF